MNVGALFIALGASLVVLWFILRQLTAKPWETPGELATGPTTSLPPQRVGLWTFLAVVTSLFGLFIAAYYERMEVNDWRPLEDPGLLWVNTVILILGSVALQYARTAGSRGNAQGLRIGLVAGGLFTWLFLGGQLLAWQELLDNGYLMSGNPANAFFYLLTGLHGVHLLGGLWVWAMTVYRLWSAKRDTSKLGAIQLSVELCTVYWHYLLLIWLVLFGLLLST